MAARSRSVIAIDCNIFLGEVAGEHAVASAAHAERHLEPDDLLLHRRGHFGLVVVGIAHALVGDPDAVEPDRQTVAVGGLAGLAYRHDDAAPIGVLAGDRGLHQ